MSLIQATRPKRRNYTIALFSTDPNSYISAMGTPWMADFFVNINSIMSDEEQRRPYFVHWTLQSAYGTAANIGTPSTILPLQVFLDFANNSYPHMYSNSQYKPVGMLKWTPDFTTTPTNYAVEAKVNDNEEIYINSLTGVNTISFSVRQLDGTMYMPNVHFSLYIHFVPADF